MSRGGFPPERAVTPSFCVRELLAFSPPPLFNIFDPLVKELSARSVKRVGVYCTRFMIDSALFGMADGVEAVQPPPDEVEYIHHTNVDLAQRAKARKRSTEASRTFLSPLQSGWSQCDHSRLTSLLFNDANIESPTGP